MNKEVCVGGVGEEIRDRGGKASPGKRRAGTKERAYRFRSTERS